MGSFALVFEFSMIKPILNWVSYNRVQRAWWLLVMPIFAQSITIPVTNNDADGDRIVDTVDIDDDNDGIPDIAEIAPNGTDLDTDRDGVPNRLDLDSDNDGILDWQESGAVLTVDFSALRVIAGRLLGPVGENGLIDALESPVDTAHLVYTLINTDFPGDDLPDVIDLDSDNDGLPDLVETGVAPLLDNDGDARIDAPPGTVGRDGIADYLQSTPDAVCCDVTSDGIDDVIPRNSDGTDLPDFQDLDSDNDGVSDLVEAGGADADGDGRVDSFFDSAGSHDGLDDALLVIPLQLTDHNGDNVPDQIDPFVQAGLPSTEGNNQATDAVEEATNGSSGANGSSAEPADDDNPATSNDLTVPDREPVSRPVAMPGSEMQPQNDAPAGEVLTGLDASGCSIQSVGMDAVLALFAIFSMAVLGWRFTLRRLR